MIAFLITVETYEIHEPYNTENNVQAPATTKSSNFVEAFEKFSIPQAMISMTELLSITWVLIFLKSHIKPASISADPPQMCVTLNMMASKDYCESLETWTST